MSELNTGTSTESSGTTVSQSSQIGSLLTDGLSTLSQLSSATGIDASNIVDKAKDVATNVATNAATNAISKFIPGAGANKDVQDLVSGAVGEVGDVLSDAFSDIMKNPAAIFQDPGKFANDLINKFIPKPRVFYSAQLFPYCFLIPMCILCLYTIGDVRKKLTNYDFAGMRNSFASLRIFGIVVTTIMVLFFLYLGRMGSKRFDPESMYLFAIMTIITVFLLYGTKVYMNVQFLVIEMNLSNYPQITVADFVYIKNKFNMLNSYIGSMMTLTLLAGIPAALMKLLEFVKSYFKDMTKGISLPF